MATDHHDEALKYTLMAVETATTFTAANPTTSTTATSTDPQLLEEIRMRICSYALPNVCGPALFNFC